MTQFTPGPWQSKHDYTIEGATTIIANADGEVHPDGTQTYSYEFICTCEDEYGERMPNAQANARLIAAAPDLYAALEWIVAHDGECLGDNVTKLLEARAALIKARGQ